VLVTTSALMQTAMLRLSPTGAHLWESDVPLLVGAGYVVPALIAHDMARQGVRKTVTAVMTAGALVSIPIVLALMVDVPGVNELQPLVGFGVSAIGPEWVPFAVVVSILTAWGLQTNLGLRSGGFVGAAYIGMLSAAPSQVVYMLVVALVTYVVVTKALMPWMILFGRRKFATMLLLSSTLSWTGMIVGEKLLHLDLVYYMTLSSVALLPLFVPGLVANDMERSGVGRVLGGLTLGAAFVVPATWVAQDVFEHGVIDPVWAGVAVVTGSAIFHRQVRAIGAFVMRWVGVRVAAPVLVDEVAVPERTPNTASVAGESLPDVEMPAQEELVGTHGTA
jgi:poly-gamma-glutamate biosynthesis protein PgsC/CapC